MKPTRSPLTGQDHAEIQRRAEDLRVRQVAAAKLWRMRDLFHCARCSTVGCDIGPDGEVLAEDQECPCPHHDDIGALSEAIKALQGSCEGPQMFREDIEGRRLVWQDVPSDVAEAVRAALDEVRRP